MEIWIDDVRPAPKGYRHVYSVDEAIDYILSIKAKGETIELIDVDHDAGDFVYYGGDYIRLLDWLEMTNRNYPIRIHSANPVGRENMRRIIQRNGWKEVL
jgi:hypothetical protein